MKTIVYTCTILLLASFFIACETDPILEDFETENLRLTQENTIDQLIDDENDLIQENHTRMSDDEEDIPGKEGQKMSDDEEDIPGKEGQRMSDDEEDIPGKEN